MTKQKFLNFAEISKGVSFREFLDWLNIPYQQIDQELKGEGFIVSIEKNLYFSTTKENEKGSVINFLSHYKQIELREAASILKAQFLSKEKETSNSRELPNLTLEYHKYFADCNIKPEVITKYEAGYVKQRSIVAGRIAFKIYDQSGNHIGYIGYKPEDKSWFFPKGFKRPLYNAFRVKDTKSAIVTVNPFDTLKIISLGITQVVSLLAKSMTAEQEEELKKFKYILLLHPEPDNIVSRLFKTSFIKAPAISADIGLSERSVRELQQTETCLKIR